jgi:hypothetical protein
MRAVTNVMADVSISTFDIVIGINVPAMVAPVIADECKLKKRRLWNPAGRYRLRVRIEPSYQR